MDIKDEQSYFFDRPGVVKWTLRIFYGICIFLVLIDFVIHRHVETSVERLPAFYAIYGFISCAILVLISAQLRKLLMREEKYYDNAELDSTDDHLSNDSENKNRVVDNE